MTDLPTPDQVGEQLDELAILLPALPDALPRDSGAGTGERVATSSDVHSIPVNPDVADALHALRGLDLRWLRRQVEGAYASGDPVRIRHLAATIRADLDLARRALGLNRPDIALPGARHCPDHDTPLTPLVTPGERGTLIYDRLDEAGRPVAPWIRWTHDEVIMCRHCGRTWTPAQYPWLGRLVRHADRRRASGAA